MGKAIKSVASVVPREGKASESTVSHPCMAGGQRLMAEKTRPVRAAATPRWDRRSGGTWKPAFGLEIQRISAMSMRLLAVRKSGK